MHELKEWAARGLPIIIIMIVTIPQTIGADSSNFALYGPRVDQIIYKIYPENSLNAAMLAIQSGRVDVIPDVWSVYHSKKLGEEDNVRLHISSNGSPRLTSLFLNCRRGPLDDAVFRNAVSYIVDRDAIAYNVTKGWVKSVDSFIPTVSQEWVEPESLPGFNFERAWKILDEAGYTVDALSNRRMDPRTREPLRDLTIFTLPVWEDQAQWALGEMVFYYATILRIPVRHITLTKNDLMRRAIHERDFDMIVLETDFDYPPYILYDLLHSSRDEPGTLAVSGIDDADLDEGLEHLMHGVSKIDLMDSTKEVQRRLADLTPYVPVYTSPIISAFSLGWEGVVTIEGCGAVNMWTYTNIHLAGKPFGGTLIQAIEGEIESLNPCLAGPREWIILKQLYSPLIALDPLTMQETPVLAEEWTMEPWQFNGDTGMKIAFKIRDGVLWQDGEPFTAEDVRFCIEYLKAGNVPTYERVLKDLVKVEAPDSKNVNIYFNTTGYSHLLEVAEMTFLPKHIWEDVLDYRGFQPWKESHPEVQGLTKLVGQGPFIYTDSNITETVRLVWNPVHVFRHPEKPSLLEGLLRPQVAQSGENIVIRYLVCNHTSEVLSDSGAGFTLRIKEPDGGLVLEKQAVYHAGAYEVQLDTSSIGHGEFTCEFVALPYGVDAFSLRINQPPSTGIPGFPLPAMVLGLSIILYVLYRCRGQPLHAHGYSG